ncbi:Enoyl-(Acyl carrier protein) reductase [Teratosphaeria destructans]|uniref:Enoyl-(Acyl carrier protein) reductase n=1 Tax=Teratosphaeria destructans TaxID=418781 RepID=A0A9W7SM76_9PEZI|nr:Enoyl-(Acyl carrier protein) reductase [Teratosphaeria destructans]
MPTAVLTGCNSGIGYETAKLALASGWKVHALDVQVGSNLRSLESQNCKIAQVDVTDPESIRKFGQDLLGEPIDFSSFCALGIMPDPKTHDRLDTLTLPTMERCFAINAYGPLLLTQALLPNILAADKPSRIAVISSRVGSLADNTSGGMYAYRASKTAVNSLFKSLAIELKDKGVVVTMLHPGFTKTNLNPEIKKVPGAVEPEVAAQGLWNLVLQKDVEETGRFWHREGYELPW